MALLVLVLLVVLVSRIVGGVVSLFDSGDGTAAGSGSTGPSGGSVSSSPAIVAPPVCTYGRQLTTLGGYGQWDQTLLDTSLRLARSYAPPDLVPISQAGFGGSAMRIRSFVIDDLAALREAAVQAGLPIGVVAAYRSYQEQASLFDRRKADLGLDAALGRTARAGHSEHQLGTSIDFKTKGDVDVDRKWAATPTGRWMQENAWRYGFILSYPGGQGDVTCYGSEPWHFRYFGRDLAARIHDSGLTVREFLWDRLQAGPAPVP